MKGRRVPLSLPRRLATEYCHAARRVPRAVLARSIPLGPIAAARAAAGADRPPWTAILARAWGIAAAAAPVLRRVYVQLPWPGLYELPAAVVTVVVARDVAGEPGLIFCRIKDPAALPLAEIAARIRHAQIAPLTAMRDARRAFAIARLPWPLRRALFWLGLNLGRQVGNWYGTCGISALGAEGVSIPAVIAPWAGFLNAGPIGADGMAALHFSFDHRVMDGREGARAVAALVAALHGPVLAELRAMARPLRRVAAS